MMRYSSSGSSSNNNSSNFGRLTALSTFSKMRMNYDTTREGKPSEVKKSVLLLLLLLLLLCIANTSDNISNPHHHHKWIHHTVLAPDYSIINTVVDAGAAS